MSIKRIMIAVDDSPIAAHAAEFGAELASSSGAQLALFNAPEIPPGADGLPMSEMIKGFMDEGKKLVARICETLKLPDSTTHFVAVGPASTEIARAAKEWGADLIVVGSHGRSGISRALLGSVAEGVIRHAHCPVLVFKAPT